MNSKEFNRLLHYDSLFETKFKFRNISFWPYIRQYFFKRLRNNNNLSNRKESLPIKNLIKVFFSHLNIKKVGVVYLISNRPQIVSLVEQFKKTDIKLDSMNSLYMCQIGYSSPIKGKFIYTDLPKVITRSLFFFSKPKNLSKYINLIFIEGVLMYYYYKLIFRILRPKIVYFINWYDHYPALLALPKKTNNVEIQHGIIYNQHPGYNYGVKNSREIRIPNNFKLWNQDFVKSINLGKPFNYSVFNRNPFIKSEFEKKKNLVVIISQHSIRSEIEHQLKINYKRFIQLGEIIYRIHPKDSHKFLEIKEHMKKLDKITVESPYETPIESYLDSSNTFVGVFSTLFMDLIIEGYDCIVLNHPHKEALQSLLNRDNVRHL